MPAAQPAPGSRPAGAPAPAVDAGTDMLALLRAQFDQHYQQLVRLGALLLHDVGAAEDVVQDAFVALHGRPVRLRDPDRALAYLRRCVVNGCRTRQRRAAVAARVPDPPPQAAPAADVGALAHELRDAVLHALDALSHRQREVMVLRHYLDLTETQIAATLGISAGAVKVHNARAAASLRRTLEDFR